MLDSCIVPLTRASISQDYWGDIKEEWGSGDGSPPEAEAFFVKLHIIFALKYNKQQLLLLLDKITSKILGDITMDVPLS